MRKFGIGFALLLLVLITVVLVKTEIHPFLNASERPTDEIPNPISDAAIQRFPKGSAFPQYPTQIMPSSITLPLKRSCPILKNHIPKYTNKQNIMK